MFKGKFIYWGLGSIVLGLLLCMALSSLINLIIGILSLMIFTGGGLSLTAMKQKQGLNSKSRFTGVCILQTNYQKYDKD